MTLFWVLQLRALLKYGLWSKGVMNLQMFQFMKMKVNKLDV